MLIVCLLEENIGLKEHIADCFYHWERSSRGSHATTNAKDLKFVFKVSTNYL